MFAPIIVLTRNWFGKKEFNRVRGQVIALHSKVITGFCQNVGIESKQRQSLIRLARDNGKRLGFLA